MINQQLTVRTSSEENTLISTYLTVLGLLVVAAVAIGAGSYWYFGESEQVMRVSSLDDLDSISQIRIQSRAQSQTPTDEQSDQQSKAGEIVLDKSDTGGWYIQSPFVAKASDSRVDSVILALPAHQVEHSFDRTEVDLAQFGLEQPQVRVWFDELEFALGNTDPLTGYRYVLHQDKVFLLESAEYELLDSGAYALCESRLSQYSADISAIEIGHYRLGLDDNDAQWRWQLLEKATSFAAHAQIPMEALSTDNDELKEWVDKWSYAYTLHARDGSDVRKDAGEVLPLVRIEFSTGEVMTYELIQTKDETIFHNPENSVNYHFSTETQRSTLSLPLMKRQEQQVPPESPTQPSAQ